MVDRNALTFVICVYPPESSLLKILDKKCVSPGISPWNLTLESFLYITTLLSLVLNIDAEQPEW